jgi:hypothetical protein
MGRRPKHSPKNLGEKLQQIRVALGYTSYGEMIEKLNLPEMNLYRASIHEYESNKRTPPLLVLLRYSELSGILINDLVDDRVELSDLKPK